MKESDIQTEDKIFEAATRVFTEKGFDGARMHEIAEEAGINKALLHYYFRTKEKLFDAVFSKLAASLFEKFTPMFRPGMSLEEKIRFFYHEHISFLKQNPHLPSFILNELNRNPQRIKKIFEKADLDKIYNMLSQQHPKELAEINITRESMHQIMASIAAMSAFPFVAKGIIGEILRKQGKDFDSFIEERKEFAPEFVLAALKNFGKSKKSKK